MAKLTVEGGVRLEGTVEVSGSKNSALPILCAALAADGPCRIAAVPNLTDVDTLADILRRLGVRIEREADGTIATNVVDPTPTMAPYDLVRKMRASFCVMGPLLGRRGEAQVSLPGGCVIGLRPVDLHLKGFRALGAEISVEHGYVIARAPAGGLRGAHMYLGGPFGPTVTGTANVLMAACFARGKTVIENAACEPEVADLATFLVRMGAEIEGIGTPRLVIHGVRELHGTDHRVVPDRIEAGTLCAAAAVTQGDVRVEGIATDHLAAFFDKLEEIGVRVDASDDSARIVASGRLEATEVVTLPYPGFPTDLQAQMTALLSLARGISVVTERIYPDRFMHLAELSRLGADIHKEGATAVISGVDHLSGAQVMASDLRASAALVLAGLAATGRTVVDRIYHLDRGYERLDAKLTALGARIERVLDAADAREGGGEVAAAA